MTRIVLLVLVVMASLGVYTLRERAAQDLGAECFRYPSELAQTTAACDRVLAGDVSDNRRGEALFFKGLAEDLHGSPEAAMALYDAALELIPERRSAYYNRANLRLKAEDYDGALADARVVERRWPDARDDAWHWNQITLFRAMERLGQDREALSVANAYLEARPDDVKSRRWRSWFLAHHDLEMSARQVAFQRLRDLSHVIGLGQGSHKDFEHRAEVLAQLNLSLLSTQDAVEGLTLIEAEARARGEVTEEQMNAIDATRRTAARIRDALEARIAENSALPMGWQAYVNRAADYFRLAEIDRALADLAQAEALKPGAVPPETMRQFQELRDLLDGLGLLPGN